MECYTRYASRQNQNSIRWPQHAHLLWLRDGDQNTALFHNTAHIYSHYNSISQIFDSNGATFIDHPYIECRFINFYSTLWSDNSNSTFIDIFNSLLNDLPTLFDSDGLNLIGEVSREEVYATIQDLPSGKSPWS